MKVVRYVQNRPRSIAAPVLTAGNFDGVHLGHQALLRGVITEAKRLRGASVVLTFEPHPLQVLAPGRAPRRILSLRDKLELLRSAGVDWVVIQKFTTSFARIEAVDFVQQYLWGTLRPRVMWVGSDFKFGKGRRGTVEDLTRWGKLLGFDVKVVNAVQHGRTRVSSSRVRQVVEAGEVHLVTRYLGRYHFVAGNVVRGHRRGRLLGFPTANIASRTEVVPRNGIYATFVEVEGKYWPSVTSIGTNPTFGAGQRTIETYILGFRREIYGRRVRVVFIRRLRSEKKFASIELLVAQMRKDVLKAEGVLQRIDAAKLCGFERLDKEVHFA